MPIFSLQCSVREQHSPVPGSRELRIAKGVLGDSNVRQEPILTAAQLVWSAMFYEDEWPQGLQTRAAALQPALFKYGTIEMTVKQMGEPELAELRRALLDFLDSFEAASA